MQRLQSVRVPETNVAVCSSSTRSQKAILMRRPAYSLDCSCVLVELDYWLVWVQIPNHQFVIVAARCELLIIEAPLQAANLLLVTHQLAEVRALSPQVSLQNVTVTAARADH